MIWCLLTHHAMLRVNSSSGRLPDLQVGFGDGAPQQLELTEYDRSSLTYSNTHSLAYFHSCAASEHLSAQAKERNRGFMKENSLWQTSSRFESWSSRLPAIVCAGSWHTRTHIYALPQICTHTFLRFYLPKGNSRPGEGWDISQHTSNSISFSGRHFPSA